MGNAIILDPERGISEVHNDTNLPTSDIFSALLDQHGSAGPMRAIANWVTETQGGVNKRAGGLFERDRYVTPNNMFDQMRLAAEAVENDDIVGGVCESTEMMALNKIMFQAADEDEEDIYNQIAGDIDLDSRLREMWRDLFTYSQFYMAVWWHDKEFKVRGKREERQAKKKFKVRCPKAITLINPLKVIPIGTSLFGQERLAYVAEREEDEQFAKALASGDDPIVSTMIVAKLSRSDLTKEDIAECGKLQVSPERLWLLNPNNVFRHTSTKPGHKRFADVRMKGIFEVLDLKHQLRQMDRAHLIGATHFIVLITKGSDAMPAKPAEIANLQTQVKTVARVPVLVGDHRLNVEIVTPKLDQTIKAERYNALDSRITGRLYMMFVLGNYAAGSSGDDSVKLAKMVARGMESRRHMISRTLERSLWIPMFEKNQDLKSTPKLRFNPRSIALDFDAAFASFLLDMRERNEVSRDTILSAFDMDQEEEARNLEREEEKFDDIFKTQTPFSAENPRNANDPTQAQPAVPGAPAQPNQRRNANTGRRKGGAAPGSGQGQEPRRPRKPSNAEDDTGDDD